MCLKVNINLNEYLEQCVSRMKTYNNRVLWKDFKVTTLDITSVSRNRTLVVDNLTWSRRCVGEWWLSAGCDVCVLRGAGHSCSGILICWQVCVIVNFSGVWRHGSKWRVLVRLCRKRWLLCVKGRKVALFYMRGRFVCAGFICIVSSQIRTTKVTYHPG